MDINYSQTLVLHAPGSFMIGDATLVFDADRVSDADTEISPSTPIATAKIAIGHARTFARKFNEFQEIPVGVNALISFDVNVQRVGTDIVLKAELKGDVADTQIDHEWVFDTLTKTFVFKKKNYSVTFACFVAYLDVVERYLSLCGEF